MTHEMTLKDVFAAAKRIEPLVYRTPLIRSPGLEKQTGAKRVYLKLESLQNTGAFKVRGAANKISSLSDEEKKRGVITFSTGNHGKAVAYVAGRMGIPAVVCISEHVPSYRAERIRELGAEVVQKGHSQDEAEALYYEIMHERNMIPVVPFDDPHIIAGQGTIGLEMMRDRPELDTLLVPLSGGGLLAGVALSATEINPAMEVVGVSIERSPAMLESLKAGRPVQVEEKDTLADSLLGGIGTENNYTLPLIQQRVKTHLVVGEQEIERAMYTAFSEHSLVIEGAAAVGIAALQNGLIDVSGKSVGLVISGSSVEPARYLGVLQKYIEG